MKTELTYKESKLVDKANIVFNKYIFDLYEYSINRDYDIIKPITQEFDYYEWVSLFEIEFETKLPLNITLKMIVFKHQSTPKTSPYLMYLFLVNESLEEILNRYNIILKHLNYEYPHIFKAS